METRPATLDPWSKDDYTQVAVAYLDMFGFGHYLREDGAPVDDALGWLGELDREGDQLRKRIHDAEQLKSAVSSDTMLRALPIRHGTLGIPNALDTLIADTILVQRRLTQWRWEKGNKHPPVLPLRGGICVGNLYWGEHHIFGEALVRAAELEKKVASWPRVVVGSEIAPRPADPQLWYPRDLADYFTCGPDGFPLLREDGGVRYVNYLAPIRTHCEWADMGFYRTYLADHRGLVLKFWKDAKTDEERGRVRCWAEYHNSIVRLLKEDRHASSFFNKKELLIDL